MMRRDHRLLSLPEAELGRHCLNAANQFCTTASDAARGSSVFASCTISNRVPSGDTSNPARASRFAGRGTD